MVNFFKKKEKEGETKFKCDYCDMEFTEKIRLERHRKKAHGKGKGGGDLPNPNPFSF